MWPACPKVQVQLLECHDGIKAYNHKGKVSCFLGFRVLLVQRVDRKSHVPWSPVLSEAVSEQESTSASTPKLPCTKARPTACKTIAQSLKKEPKRLHTCGVQVPSHGEHKALHIEVPEVHLGVLVVASSSPAFRGDLGNSIPCPYAAIPL